MEGEHHHSPGVLVFGRRCACQPLALANHAILEVPDLHDTIPGRCIVLCKLAMLCLQDMTVDESGSWGYQHLMNDSV